MVLMRHIIGEVLRDYRIRRKLTLRDVASNANVALGYLSEIERGQKEASSEVLLRITEAMNEPLSQVLIEVGDRLALFEDIELMVGVPDTVPDDFHLSGNK